MPRLPALTLLVLLLAADRGNTAALLGGSGVRADGRMEVRSMLDIVGRHQWSRTQPELSGHAAKERESSSHQALERNPRDPRLKERFIKHLTGPLYVNKKCRKHFHRLYHNTRDCTIPAFYKRCARLLTRLANSPHCTER